MNFKKFRKQNFRKEAGEMVASNPSSTGSAGGVSGPGRHLFRLARWWWGFFQQLFFSSPLLSSGPLFVTPTGSFQPWTPGAEQGWGWGWGSGGGGGRRGPWGYLHLWDHPGNTVKTTPAAFCLVNVSRAGGKQFQEHFYEAGFGRRTCSYKVLLVVSLHSSFKGSKDISLLDHPRTLLLGVITAN